MDAEECACSGASRMNGIGIMPEQQRQIHLIGMAGSSFLGRDERRDQLKRWADETDVATCRKECPIARVVETDDGKILLKEWVSMPSGMEYDKTGILNSVSFGVVDEKTEYVEHQYFFMHKDREGTRGGPSPPDAELGFDSFCAHLKPVPARPSA